jgi:hypothetical protein
MLAPETIFLTGWSNVSSHASITWARNPYGETRDTELFPISKTRAKTRHSVSLAGLGLGGRWRGLPITRG